MKGNLAEIKTQKEASNYDLVLIGTPVFGWNLTPPVKTYVTKHKNDLKKSSFYHKQQLEDLEKSLPFEHFIFDLKATVEECIVRDKSRKSIGQDAIRAVHSMVSEFDYGVAINTGSKTVEGVAGEIMGLIERN